MPVTNLNPALGNFNPIEDTRSTAKTLTSVSISSTSTSLAAANPTRRTISLYNAGSNTIFVAEGAVTTTLYDFQLPPGFYWTPDGPDIYLGAYNGITASGTSTILVGQA